MTYEQVQAIKRAANESCYGGPIPDHVVWRESRGQPFVWNSEGSGAFGCFQIMPLWWSGRCSHLNKWSVAQQKDCARIILATQGPGAWGGF